MGANPTIQLAIVRSQIDKQQQVIALLEQKLQEAILGGTDAGAIDLREEDTYFGLIDRIGEIYGEQIGVDAGGNPIYTDFEGDINNPGDLVAGRLTSAIWRGMRQGFDETFVAGETMVVEQDALRQMLYQARALLGELRVEEQHWNGEVNEEKARRKDLGELSKA